MIRKMSTPDGISQSNVPIKSLIASAYGVKDDLVSGGPAWVDSTPYDVEAKVAGPDVPTYKALSNDQRNLMLQALLTDRFKLAVHTETKELPVYELVVAKGGPKLTEAKTGDTYPNGFKGPDGVGHGGMMRIDGRGKLTAQGIPMANLVDILSRQLHRTIVDKTGLTGKYDFNLEYTPDDAPRGDGPAHGDAAAPDPNGPTIFTALEEQLGLHLNSTKGPVKTIIIDHIEAAYGQLRMLRLDARRVSWVLVHFLRARSHRPPVGRDTKILNAARFCVRSSAISWDEHFFALESICVEEHN